MILDAEISVFQFVPGLCFYPEFGVSVRSSVKEPGQRLVRSLGLEFGERVWPNPGSAGSELGKRKGPNPGSAGLEFGERNGPNPALAGSEKRQGLTLVRQVRS